MSLTYKRRGGKEYLYFQAGTEGTYYIAPKDEPSKVNIDGVVKSLNYALRRLQNYQAIIDELLSLLPEDEQRKYLQKEEMLRLQEKEIPSKIETKRSLALVEPLILEIRQRGFKMTVSDEKRIRKMLEKYEKGLNKTA